MTNRTTKACLESLVKNLNQAMGRPLTPYSKVGEKLVANIGNFHLDWAYGGVCVHEMDSESGGINKALGMYGYGTKSECEAKLRAALWALEKKA